MIFVFQQRRFLCMMQTRRCVQRCKPGRDAINRQSLRSTLPLAAPQGGERPASSFGSHPAAVFVASAPCARYHPGKKLFVGGFSFGAWVASRAACEMPNVDALFLIGTPVNKYDFGYLRHCDKPMLFLHGTQDEFGDVEKLEKLIPLVHNAESVIVTGADHFFTKQIDAVEETMRSWAVEILGL